MRAIFLDLIGTLTPIEPEEWENPSPETKKKIARIQRYLGALKRSGVKLIVVSSVEKEGISWLLHHFQYEKLVDEIHSTEDEPIYHQGGKRQTALAKAEIIRKVLREHGINPRDSIMVGDGYVDREAALRARVRPVLTHFLWSGKIKPYFDTQPLWKQPVFRMRYRKKAKP